MADSVTRYVPTYVNRDGQRTLMCPAQGRHTFAEREVAQGWLDAVAKNSAPTTLEQVFGPNPQFEVRPCECWPDHFDPKSIYFDA
jgi:hypothetical protein